MKFKKLVKAEEFNEVKFELRDQLTHELAGGIENVLDIIKDLV